MKYKYLILGGGPAGLTFATLLKMHGENKFILIEKEKNAGGLCRSINLDSAPLDIGGGHFLDVRRPKVVQFLFKFMPSNEWNIFNRISKIKINDYLIDHPFESNIWQFPNKISEEYLISIKNAGCNNGIIKPEKFIDWIKWKLGDKIASDYMIPYNMKMFGSNLNLLGTYWLEKLPDVSYDDTLNSIINRKSIAKQPGHATFYYPKYFGYGEVWARLADYISNNMIINKSVTSINFNNSEVQLDDNEKISADTIITSIPWVGINLINLPEDIKFGLTELKYTSVNVSYHSESIDSDAHWIYYPDLNLPYHRKLLRQNFCNSASGYWTETNSERYIKENCFTYKNEFAYPLNTINKRECISKLLDFAKTKNIYGLGRWGEWEHYNSDTTVEKAMILFEKLFNL